MDEAKQAPAIILITHGHMGQELLRSVEMIIGHVDDFYCLSLMEGMDPMELRQELLELIKGFSVPPILMTDLYGGSPSNIAATFVGRGAADVIAGVNLPMVIEAVMLRIQGRYDMGQQLVAVGQEAVVDIGKVMRERKR